MTMPSTSGTQKKQKTQEEEADNPEAVSLLDNSYDSDESENLPIEPDSDDEDELQDEDILYDNLNVNDFLIVWLDYSTKSKNIRKNFICQIVRKTTPNDITCSFLRKSVSGMNIYVFPNETDECDVSMNQIIKVVKPLFVKRGRYSFPYEL